MSDSIQKTIPKVLKSLWDMENELRSAARNTVIMRSDEARAHLAQARLHLNALLNLSRFNKTGETGDESADETVIPPAIKH